VDEATAKIYRGVLRRALELNLLTDMQKEKFEMYVVLPSFVSGERVDFATQWEFVPNSEFQKIQKKDNAQVTATRQQDGRFALDASASAGSWLPYYNYVRYGAWAETPVSYLLASLFTDGWIFALTSGLIFLVPHLIFNRKVLRHPSVWMLFSAQIIGGLLLQSPDLQTLAYIFTGALTIEHFLNNWKLKLAPREIDVSSVIEKLSILIERAMDTDTQTGHLVVEFKIGQDIRLRKGELENEVRALVARYYLNPANVYIDLVPGREISMRVAELGPKGAMTMYGVPGDGVPAVVDFVVKNIVKLVEENPEEDTF
jgi:hypothetical protein